MNLKTKTNMILNSYGLKAKKRFGQNFLIDDNVVNNIIECSDIAKDDIVIEIGPGIGNLTEKLLEKAKLVLAYEIDQDMIDILNIRFKGNAKFNLVNKDFLKVNLKEELLNLNINKTDDVRIVANLPYYITTPIMFKIFEESENIKSMTIMVQKEVADRVVASPKSKNYGVLTVNTKYYGKAQKMFDVNNTAFIPAPNVTSSIIKIELGSNYNIKNKETFFKLVKAAFAQRRKKLINSLESSRQLDVDKETLKKILNKLNINENARAEELEIETYIDIADYIDSYAK